MQPFKINRKSWHYKMNVRILNDNYPEYWERKHNTFCSYWRATILRMVSISLVAGGLTGLLSLLAYYVYTDPIGIFVTIAGILTLFVVMIGVPLGIVALNEYVKHRNQDKPETLISMKIRAAKSKICPIVEYNND